jgi:hypothetical protein
MQFKPWFEIYKENKDNIKNPHEFFKQWEEFHHEFINDSYIIKRDSKWKQWKNELIRLLLKKKR